MPVKDELTSTTPAKADESPAAAPTSPNDVSLAKPASAADLLNPALWEGDKFVGKPQDPGVAGDDPAATSKEAEASDTSAEQPASDAAAATTPPPIPEEQSVDPATVQKLFEENRQLLRLKGKQGNELGAARNQIAELEARLARLEKGGTEQDTVGEKIPQTDEEWDNLFTVAPRKALALHNRLQREAEAAEAQRRQQEEAAEVIQVTPEVGAELFIRKVGIENFDTWSESPEGEAVLQVLGTDRKAKAALYGAITVGDAEVVADILASGLKAVRSKSAANEAQTKAAAETKRIEASKPAVLARPGRPVAPSTPTPIMQQSYKDWLNMTDEEWARQASGR